MFVCDRKMRNSGGLRIQLTGADSPRLFNLCGRGKRERILQWNKNNLLDTHIHYLANRHGQWCKCPSSSISQFSSKSNSYLTQKMLARDIKYKQVPPPPQYEEAVQRATAAIHDLHFRLQRDQVCWGRGSEGWVGRGMVPLAEWPGDKQPKLITFTRECGCASLYLRHVQTALGEAGEDICRVYLNLTCT